MRNLAGNPDCDVFIRDELTQAKIPMFKISVAHYGEVRFNYFGTLGRFAFFRNWYYWVAKAIDGDGIPLKVAEEFNLNNKADVRVDGFAGGIDDIKSWAKNKNTIDLYHIDTQEGLNAFANLLKSLKND